MARPRASPSCRSWVRQDLTGVRHRVPLMTPRVCCTTNEAKEQPHHEAPEATRTASSKTGNHEVGAPSEDDALSRRKPGFGTRPRALHRKTRRSEGCVRGARIPALMRFARLIGIRRRPACGPTLLWERACTRIPPVTIDTPCSRPRPLLQNPRAGWRVQRSETHRSPAEASSDNAARGPFVSWEGTECTEADRLVSLYVSLGVYYPGTYSVSSVFSVVKPSLTLPFFVASRASWLNKKTPRKQGLRLLARAAITRS